MRKYNHREFFQFLIVGGISAGVNFISRIGFSELVSYRYAIILAYIVGMLTAFLLSKYYVFEKVGAHIKMSLETLPL